MSLPDLDTYGFMNVLAQRRGVCFVHADDGEETYERLHEMIDWNCRALRKLGCTTGRGGCVALNVLLGWRAVPVLLAALREGVPVVPVDPFRSPELTARVLKEVRPLLVLNQEQLETDGRIALSRVLETPPYRQGSVPSGVALIMYTSGTGGFPKGVMLTYRNLWSNVTDILGYFGLRPEDRLMLVRPLTHASAITGELLPALYCGCSIAVKPHDVSPLRVIRDIEEQRPTVLCTTPTVASAFTHFADRYDVTSLRSIMLSGELLLSSHYERIAPAFPSAAVGNAYGLTEASPRVSCQPDIRQADSLRCVGRPLRQVKVKIAGSGGEPLPEGERGELWVSGPNVMLGYYGDEPATRRKLQDGWLRTSDLASVHGGMLYVHGRADDLIIRGGVNVHPAEIESFLLGIEGVTEALVFGRRDAHGMRAVAWLVTEPGLERSDVYRRILRAKRDARLWPDAIEIKSALPKTSSGKLIRPRMENGEGKEGNKIE
ncbi:long-chain-fatty-acid--CoA ligase LcfB [Paenibacillus elgii]|uniref:class I adenylate-forming enzyme family protein n=1 Tax=Paenibacillus elgii TaxID=189691 RepID=UPI002D7B5FD2|nr:long-chain-fatty-acid--CoA ligase LcfB [Paenibacillus elgii]